VTAKVPQNDDDAPTSTPSMAGRPTQPAPEPSAESATGSQRSSEVSHPGPPSSVRGPSMSFDEIAPPVADPLLGVVVAERYRIRELLGRGGMGIVYEVEHTRIGKLLAMKLLTGELSRNSEVVRRFKQEALTASKLSSPNTVQVFDFGVSDGLTYLVMELIAGDDLGKVLRSEGPMPPRRLARIMIQICSSLAEAHQNGIVHRDIKPENIMLVRARDGSDIAKVLDFGLAKLRDGADLNDVTTQGAIVGTPYFMSPEQIRGEAVDARSDVYSIGAVMYRAVTGHYPFNGPSPMAVFTKHLTESPEPPTDRAPELDIPQSMSDIIMKALARIPTDRWQRVEDLQEALISHARGASNSSVDNLLDSSRVRDLARASPVDNSQAVAGVTGPPAAIATRDEVERYERKLRRKRWGLLAFVLLLPLGVAGVGVRYYMARPVEFGGVELEPNDEAKQATEVPLGRSVSGYLGRRIDDHTGDRDFYSFEVPTRSGSITTIQLSVAPIPNFSTCTFIYRQGQPAALAQFCVGRAGRALEVPRLELPPGRYLAAVMQDLDPYGSGRPPFVHENVSDSYELRIDLSDEAPELESEPNDHLSSANAIEMGGARRGQLGWVNDEDILCAVDAAASAVWKIEDGPRDAGTVLLVTPIVDGNELAPIRVHHAERGKVTDVDVVSPWTSPAADSVEGDFCVKLELAADPWTSNVAELVPRGSAAEFEVRLVSP